MKNNNLKTRIFKLNTNLCKENPLLIKYKTTVFLFKL